jgi:hypothetical protein
MVSFGSMNSSERLYLCLRLLQPVRHPHLAIHRRRGSEMLLRLLTLARAPGELAEAEVAVSNQGGRLLHVTAADSSSSNILASRRSAVSKPSVNQE